MKIEYDFPTIKTATVPDSYMSNYDAFEKGWISTSALSLLMMCGQAFNFKYVLAYGSPSTSE